MSQEKRSPIEVVKAHMAAEDRRDVEAALACFTEDCYYRVPGLEIEIRGKGALRRWYQDLFVALPDFRNTDARYYEADGQVFFEANFQATHLGTWDGWAPTGRTVCVPMLVRIPFARDGLMEAEIVYADSAGLLMQMGILPRKGSEVERAMQGLHRLGLGLLKRLRR
jgi:steroid delta-isomerase-like uncharacterized protein